MQEDLTISPFIGFSFCTVSSQELCSSCFLSTPYLILSNSAKKLQLALHFLIYPICHWKAFHEKHCHWHWHWKWYLQKHWHWHWLPILPLLMSDFDHCKKSTLVSGNHITDTLWVNCMLGYSGKWHQSSVGKFTVVYNVHINYAMTKIFVACVLLSL